MGLGSSGGRHRAAAFAAAPHRRVRAAGVSPAAVAAGTRGTAPNLTAASAYLVAPANLIDGHYYESFPGTADFGLTIDGALALAATGDEDAALRKIVAFLADDGKDPSGDTRQRVDRHRHVRRQRRRDRQGGAAGRGSRRQPAKFRRAQPDRRAGCLGLPAASAGGNTSCPAAGSYLNATSMFDQALGVIAQLRAGQVSEAAAPIAYLERLQSANGSFPSLIPPSGGPDVDSTADGGDGAGPGTRRARLRRCRGRPDLDRQPTAAQWRIPRHGRGIDQLDRSGHPGADAAGRRLPGPHQRGGSVPGRPAERRWRVQRRRGPAWLESPGVNPGRRRGGRHVVRHAAHRSGQPAGSGDKAQWSRSQREPSRPTSSRKSTWDRARPGGMSGAFAGSGRPHRRRAVIAVAVVALILGRAPRRRRRRPGRTPGEPADPATHGQVLVTRSPPAVRWHRVAGGSGGRRASRSSR